MAEQRQDPGRGVSSDPRYNAGTGLGLGTRPAPTAKPKKKAAVGPGTAYSNYINANPALRPYSDMIWKWANRYGLDPTYFAALINFESVREAKRQGKDPTTIMSPTGKGFGLGQINPSHVGDYVEWLGRKLTREDLKNPNINLRWSAEYFAKGKAKYGTYEATYNNWYNNGYAGPSPFADVPKDYVPRSGKVTPEEAAANAAETASAKQTFNDPWVTVVNGKVKFKKGDQPPKNALLVDGLPITASVFLSQRRQLEETYVSYTGKRPTNEQVANFLHKGWSVYTLQTVLSKTKDFLKSPVYKSVAPGYQASADGLLAPGEKLDPELIRQAAINNWSGDVLQAQLRKRPGYVKSTEFKGRASTLSNVYMSIYGTPNDPQELSAIREATLGGWSMDQFAGWLRSRPEYTRSSEYQTKMIGFLDQLGLITGQVPVLRPGAAPKNTNPNMYGPLPDDPRITGKAGIDPDNKMAVSFGG